MSAFKILGRLLLLMLAITVLMDLQPVNAANEPDPRVMAFKLPNQIQWKKAPSGADLAVLYGDPNKPGFYIVLNRWNPHMMSRPHFHANDRFIYVVKGTWWVGWGPKYDPASTYPMPAGSFVEHFGKQIHYDGAKDEEVILELCGQGPGTSTPAEQK